MKVYNSNDVKVLVGLLPIDGDRGDSDFCAIAKDNDDIVTHSSADGGAAISVTNDTWHTVTLTLMHSSAGNLLLSGQMAAGKLLKQKVLVLPIVVIDSASNGNLFAADKCVLLKTPDETYSKELGTVEWVFKCSDPTRFIAGH